MLPNLEQTIAVLCVLFLLKTVEQLDGAELGRYEDMYDDGIQPGTNLRPYANSQRLPQDHHPPLRDLYKVPRYKPDKMRYGDSPVAGAGPAGWHGEHAFYPQRHDIKPTPATCRPATTSNCPSAPSICRQKSIIKTRTKTGCRNLCSNCAIVSGSVTREYLSRLANVSADCNDKLANGKIVAGAACAAKLLDAGSSATSALQSSCNYQLFSATTDCNNRLTAASELATASCTDQLSAATTNCDSRLGTASDSASASCSNRLTAATTECDNKLSDASAASSTSCSNQLVAAAGDCSVRLATASDAATSSCSTQVSAATDECRNQLEQATALVSASCNTELASATTACNDRLAQAIEFAGSSCTSELSAASTSCESAKSTISSSVKTSVSNSVLTMDCPSIYSISKSSCVSVASSSVTSCFSSSAVATCSSFSSSSSQSAVASCSSFCSISSFSAVSICSSSSSTSSVSSIFSCASASSAGVVSCANINSFSSISAVASCSSSSSSSTSSCYSCAVCTPITATITATRVQTVCIRGTVGNYIGTVGPVGTIVGSSTGTYDCSSPVPLETFADTTMGTIPGGCTVTVKIITVPRTCTVDYTVKYFSRASQNGGGGVQYKSDISTWSTSVTASTRCTIG